jgi:DNA-binding CsgD family transcriptional regulator
MASLLATGDEALRAAEWGAAEEAYRAALGFGEPGEAWFGLGVVHWWRAETDDALRCWERAFTTFQGAGDPGQAVVAAVYLCLAYRMTLGNATASGGWLAQAEQLLGQLEPGGMHGWVALCRAYIANDSRRPRTAAVHAREALDVARQVDDVDLTLCASSELGAALVEVGEVDEGTALLDRAMAGALAGEGGDRDTLVLVGCRTITWCSRTADITRAIEWIRAADRANERYGSAHLFTVCRTHHGNVLFAAGEWDRAEQELLGALELGGGAEPALHAEATAGLALLRLAQGRVADAERLLAGLDDQPATVAARVVLHLANGAPTAAAALCRRRLRALDEGSIERAQLLDLLAEAEAKTPDPGAAAVPVPEVDATPRAAAAVLSVALLERAHGRLLAIAGDPEAVEHLERALQGFAGLGIPYESARTRALLAQVLAPTDAETAIAEARAALTCLDDLGAAREADETAALLRSLGVRAARAGPRGRSTLSQREQEVLALLGEGLANPAIAARLYISRRTVEHHVASVLRKLGLSGRGEVAAYVARQARQDLPRDR